MPIQLRSLVDRRTDYPFVAESAPPAETTRALATLVGEQLVEAIAAAGGQPIDAVAVTSTIASPLTFHGQVEGAAFRREIERICDVKPVMLLDAYECAGWGFVLRFFLTLARRMRIAICIVDIDTQNHSYWVESPRWGRSGFGVTCLIFDLAAFDGQPEVLVSRAPRRTALAALSRSIRQVHAHLPDAMVTGPFLRESEHMLFLRSIPEARVASSLHAEFGHCFGSDPWIGLARSGLPTQRDWIAASMALNGYLCVARLRLAEDARFECDDRGAGLGH